MAQFDAFLRISPAIITVAIVVAACRRSGNDHGGTGQQNASGQANNTTGNSDIGQGKARALGDAARPSEFSNIVNNVRIYARRDGDDNGNLSRFITGWLSANGWINFSRHSVSYPDTMGTLTTDSFTCYQIGDQALRYVPNPLSDSHRGIDMPLVKRVCTAWTYANAYDTDEPSKGKVKVFVGTSPSELCRWFPRFHRWDRHLPGKILP